MQLPIVFFLNQLLKTGIFIKRTCISIFSKIEFVDQAKPCTEFYLTTNSNFEKKTILLDMHHHKAYMYINFQQNRVKTQVITVLTSIFAKNRKLHKFATTSNNF